MTTYSLELQCISGKPKRAGDIPHPPIADIYLKTFTSDKEGRHFITPQCMSEIEIDEQIDRLIDELEQLRRKAKRCIARG